MFYAEVKKKDRKEPIFLQASIDKHLKEKRTFSWCHSSGVEDFEVRMQGKDSWGRMEKGND